jgi:hypothetical protein
MPNLNKTLPVVRNYMTVFKYIMTLLLATPIMYSEAQTFQKKFSGWWADTQWNFEFRSDGSFKRNSGGHYGNTNVLGKYEIKHDTIHLLSGFLETNGTVNEYYLIDKNGYLIDLTLLYDYKPINGKHEIYMSKERKEFKLKNKHS